MADTFVVTGAMMMCSFGLAPSSFMASPGRTDLMGNMPKGNIMDFAPMVNIMPFGMCTAPTNPEVIACCGPAPCVPAITSPWMPGHPQVMVQKQPALTRSCRNMCMWLGQISFTTDGQMPCPPPLIVPPLTTPLPDLQPDWMLTNLEPHEIWQYKHDFEDAKHAGDGDRFIADHLQEMAERYAAQGDLEKANLAMQASEQYRNRADQKQAAAMEAVNDKYVWEKPVKEQTAEMSKEDLQGIHDQAVQDQAQYQKEVEQLDKQIAEDEAALLQEGDELAAVSREQSSARNELNAANQEKADATEKRENAEKAARDAAWREESAKRRGDDEAAKYFHDQKVDAENTAKEAAKEEKIANDKVDKAQQKYDKVSDEQSQAYNDFRDHYDQHNALKEEKQTAEDNRAAAEQRANTAQTAIEAKETLEQHDAAVNNHKETLQSSYEKRDEVNALKREEQINRDEADAWFHVGEWSKEHEDQETADKVFEKSNEYDQKANEAHQQWVAKEQEYKAELSQSRQQAYGDDAMLDAYTADLKYDNAMNNLNNPKK